MIKDCEIAMEEVQRGIDYDERWMNDPRIPASKQEEHKESLARGRERMESLKRLLAFEKERARLGL